ncbi:hypothetical protein CVT24_003632 [Panaeolus cyanescens]|uniref:Uncharacterized protein n=1 Tax=Panaeolus cyanescens TaxID=181874 RepID=A0A409Y7K8_9AGAR|nr:hypothetical protein CVT24_003632 [Panaeolus cyanescens]
MDTDVKEKPIRRPRHTRNLTLADFNPSPLARYAWHLFSYITSFLEPYFRPLVRTYVIACLRVGIRWLPKITQALSFDLHDTAISFAHIPGAKIVTQHISLNATLVLTELEQALNGVDARDSNARRDARAMQGMGALKRRLADGFQRSLDKAWGEARGTASISLKLSNVVGSMPRAAKKDSLNVPFLLSPGVIDFATSVKFNPREGTLDRHGLELSLKVGDCSAKVDLLNNILDKLFPKKKVVDPLDLPSPGFTDAPFGSAFTFGSQLSAAIPSPVQSFASSLWSPSSILTTELKSPFSALLSPQTNKTFSARSPSSPFFKALSASMRPKRRYLLQTCQRLNDHRDKVCVVHFILIFILLNPEKSKGSILHSIHVSLSSIGLSILTEAETGPYKALIKGITLDVQISNPSDNDLHSHYLGSRPSSEPYDANNYSLKLLLRSSTLERETRFHVVQLARIGVIDVQALTSQWPSPFFASSPFLSHDPNASLLALHSRVGEINMSDRYQDLQRLINILQLKISSKEKKPGDSSSKPPVFPIPRLALRFEYGPVTMRLIYEHNDQHRAIELRNGGGTLSLMGEYHHAPPPISRLFPAASSVEPLLWTSQLTICIQPILTRVRLKQTFVNEGASTLPGDDFLDDPPILSIGTLDICIDARAIAELDSGMDSFPIFDLGSLAIEGAFLVETICVELWHPISVDATLRIFSLIPVPQVSSPQTGNLQTPENRQARFLKLPKNVITKFAIGHLVVLITAPDISPGESMELSRGFAIRSSLSLDYCSLRPKQEHWFHRPQRHQNRVKLTLPPEIVVDGISSSKSFLPLHEIPSLVRFNMLNFLLRTAVATQFEPDEPAIVGREDVSNSARDVIRIKHAQVDARLSCRTVAGTSHHIDVCEVNARVPFIKLDFQLAHVYSILLGLQTVEILKPPPRKAKNEATSTEELGSKVQTTVRVTVPCIQAYIKLPTQQLMFQVDTISARLHPVDPPKIKVNRLAGYVSLPSEINRWEQRKKNRWDEFLSLQVWEVCFTPLAGSTCISVDGDSGRFRIPCGFILSKLVHDASVVAKAARHIVHMAAAGCYFDMPSPTPEGPKSVPHLTIRLGYLCLEAQDDPFESKLGLIWRAGEDAVKSRLEREDAFAAKVSTILAAESITSPTLQGQEGETHYQFSPQHTVSIEEARRRMDDVHFLDWNLRLQHSEEHRWEKESAVLRRLNGSYEAESSVPLPSFMKIPPVTSDPPLLRVMFEGLCLTISPPSFEPEKLPDVMYDLGNGLPRDTQFSLLVPMHVHFTLSSLKITLRDYPLPLVHIPPREDRSQIAWTFDTDIIIAEEMGTEHSVDWVDCPIITPDLVLHGETLMSISVPKTIMPVKTYAAPIIKVSTSEPTCFGWGVSYTPAIQDVMRIVDTLSSVPRDSSPPLGFWDKVSCYAVNSSPTPNMILASSRVAREREVHVRRRHSFLYERYSTFTPRTMLHINIIVGSRDPFNITDAGSGFVLTWQGSPEIRVNYENYQKELIQVLSDEMLIAVPVLDHLNSSATNIKTKSYKKVCAHLTSGVRFGVGFVLERACDIDCSYCRGSDFYRDCRYFTFRPHYDVLLEMKDSPPTRKVSTDPSTSVLNFIHFSLSLASATKSKDTKSVQKPSNLHLTPKTFAHFWAWCALFEGALSLPIRQGNYYPPRPISPKFGRHLATIKYRFSLPKLYFMHGYIDDSRETWMDGVTTWIGIKGKVDDLQADLHQREEDLRGAEVVPDDRNTVRKKNMYAAEVVTQGLELRALLATFSEPLKKSVEINETPQRSNYRKHTGLPNIASDSVWRDLEDFVELDWTPPSIPVLHALPLASCPHFTYCKRNTALPGNQTKISKFGTEHSHICLLGKEPSVSRTQITLASARVDELKQQLKGKSEGGRTSEIKSLEKMISLIEDYITVLKEADVKSQFSQSIPSVNYYLPADIVSSDEWAEFDNVYQVHCPSVFMDSAVRDIMMQYYYCSRDRRGFEYHLSTRAVKFIRDQAKAALSTEMYGDKDKDKTTNSAQAAASALRKILRGDNSTKISVDLAKDRPLPDQHRPIDPLDGWDDGVSLRKSHCFLLLKPQIVLHGEDPADSCVLAAAQGKLQSFAIMDTLNANDPITGKVMSRNYASLSGLQIFAPTHVAASLDGSVPLEVLIDLRCESRSFERLVPQAEATFHYDKFNRLRLRNNLTSGTARASDHSSGSNEDTHLRDQTDLIRVHVPRFTMSANAEHFQAISSILTKLLLFSDPAHKTRLDRLETLIFTYDFTDLNSAANVVTSLQGRLRDALETEKLALRNPRFSGAEDNRIRLLQIQFDIFLLVEELNLLFDAIKMAQDRFDDRATQKSALLLHASSTELSWRMLDSRRNLLSKLVVANINFYWLSRQDSSTVNHLSIGDLTAFDGSRYAIWAEIVSKYEEPSNHPLYKRGLFLLANWTILAPVGGITIYECFEMSLHPIRLQIDAKVGRKVMEYIWPNRKEDDAGAEGDKPVQVETSARAEVKSPTSGRSSIDSPRALYGGSLAGDGGTLLAPRKLANSRSFTDLRSAKGGSGTSTPFLNAPGFLQRTRSSDRLQVSTSSDSQTTPGTSQVSELETEVVETRKKEVGDAQVMKTRSSQKSFILVRISSIHVLLSMVKEGSFECHDAKIKTRELEYKNQTWSFEELVQQFIPSNKNWTGWVKMAFHQPLVPVLPVAKELLSKTKWTASKSNSVHDNPFRLLHPTQMLATDDDDRLNFLHTDPYRKDGKSIWRNPLKHKEEGPRLTSKPLTTEPEIFVEPEESGEHAPAGRKRVKSLFGNRSRRSTSRAQGSTNGVSILKFNGE